MLSPVLLCRDSRLVLADGRKGKQSNVKKGRIQSADERRKDTVKSLPDRAWNCPVECVYDSVLCFEADALVVQIPRLDECFDREVELLIRCKGRVFVTGMGFFFFKQKTAYEITR